jgi:hypothetical protein
MATVKKNLIAMTCLFATVAAAGDKPLPLTLDAAADLHGKTITITRHEKPSFVAMTAGKATFALLGAGAMIAAGNTLVKENDIADPADIMERELAGAVVRHYGMQTPVSPSPVIKAEKTKDLLAVKVDTDYLLDVRSGGWNFAYYPTQWGRYWVGYSVQIELVDAKAGKVVSNLACNASTNKQQPYPTKEALLDNRAQLLKDITSALGWRCVQLLATEQFHLPAGTVAATPAEYVDPAAAYLTAHPGAYESKADEQIGKK